MIKVISLFFLLLFNLSYPLHAQSHKEIITEKFSKPKRIKILTNEKQLCLLIEKGSKLHVKLYNKDNTLLQNKVFKKDDLKLKNVNAYLLEGEKLHLFANMEYWKDENQYFKYKLYEINLSTEKIKIRTLGASEYQTKFIQSGNFVHIGILPLNRENTLQVYRFSNKEVKFKNINLSKPLYKALSASYIILSIGDEQEKNELSEYISKTKFTAQKDDLYILTDEGDAQVVRKIIFDSDTSDFIKTSFHRPIELKIRDNGKKIMNNTIGVLFDKKLFQFSANKFKGALSLFSINEEQKLLQVDFNRNMPVPQVKRTYNNELDFGFFKVPVGTHTALTQNNESFIKNLLKGASASSTRFFSLPAYIIIKVEYDINKNYIVNIGCVQFASNNYSYPGANGMIHTFNMGKQRTIERSIKLLISRETNQLLESEIIYPQKEFNLDNKQYKKGQFFLWNGVQHFIGYESKSKELKVFQKEKSISNPLN